MGMTHRNRNHSEGAHPYPISPSSGVVPMTTQPKGGALPGDCMDPYLMDKAILDSWDLVRDEMEEEEVDA